MKSQNVFQVRWIALRNVCQQFCLSSPHSPSRYSEQAFRCRSSSGGRLVQTDQQKTPSAAAEAFRRCKPKRSAEQADTWQDRGSEKSEKSAVRDFRGSEASTSSKKRGRQEAEGVSASTVKPEAEHLPTVDQSVADSSSAAEARLPVDVELAALPPPASPTIATLGAVSLQARGRQGICLDNARGVPERLGDMPLRLIIGGNNPSDHAWCVGFNWAFHI